RGVGPAAREAASADGVCCVTDTVDAPRTGTPAHVVPAADAVYVTTPEPSAEYVQVKVVFAPGARDTGPGGMGPSLRFDSPAPGPTAIVGSIPVTSAPPVFVTV